MRKERKEMIRRLEGERKLRTLLPWCFVLEVEEEEEKWKMSVHNLSPLYIYIIYEVHASKAQCTPHENHYNSQTSPDTIKVKTQ